MSLCGCRAHALSTFHSMTIASNRPTEEDGVYIQRKLQEHRDGEKLIPTEGYRDRFMKNVKIHLLDIHFNARNVQKYICLIKLGIP